MAMFLCHSLPRNVRLCYTQLKIPSSTISYKKYWRSPTRSLLTRSSNPHTVIGNSNIPLSYPYVPKRHYSSVISFTLADIGEGISEVDILEWFVKEGSTIAQFDPLCEVQSDKATVSISSRYTGTVVKLHYKAGETAKVGQPLCDIKVEDEVVEKEDNETQIQPEITPKPEPSHTITTSKGTHKVLAAPAVRFLAKKNNLDLSQVAGSGKDGRVTKGDLLQLMKGTLQQPTQTETPLPLKTVEPLKPPCVPLPTADGLEIKQVITLRGYSRTMAQTMTWSLSIPHLGYCDEIHMDKLMQFRHSMKSTVESRGIKLSYMPFVIKAASLAIKKYPIINSRINNELTEVTLFENHNVGIAIATPQGLAVPNIKNVQDLSLFEVAQKLTQLIERAQNNKLSMQDLQGTTFSISNIGALGGTYASPVIVPPQVCIGALGKVQKLPRYNSHNEVVPVHLMNISWSADHRVIDGATIANFSNTWKNYLEEPITMLMDTK